MFKKLLQLKTLLVALLVMTGAGNAWADEELYYTLTPATGSNNSYTGNCDVTIDGITWNIGGNSQQIPWRIGGKSITNKDRIVYSKTAMTSAISKVKLEVGAASSITVNSLKLIVASDASFTTQTQIDEVTATFAENSTITFTPSSPAVEWSKDAYYKFVFNVTVSGSSNKFVEFKSAKFYHQVASLEDSDLAITNASDTLKFDLYNNVEAQTVSYTTSSTGAVSVSGGEGYVTTSLDLNTKTITVTPTAVTPSPQTITISQEADATYNASYVTFTVKVDDSTPVPTHTATFSVNGVTSSQVFKEGASIIFPANPDDINDKTFVGWVTDAIEGTTDTAPSFVTSATMGSSDVTYYAVFAKREGGVTEKDELNQALTGVTGTSYTNWSDKTDNSAAVYAGNSAGGNSYIQLRSKNNNSGIVTTTSGGTLTKVAVTWNSNTIAGRTLNVYGSNTAYDTAADLYDSSKQGTLLGTIAYGTSTELTVSGDYAYVGLRSDDGAMYLDQVDITWSVSSNTYSAYCTSVIETPKTATTLTIDATGLTNTDVYVSTAAGALAATVRPQESDEPVEDVTVTWTSSNTDVATIAADGKVTLVAAGKTILTATYAGDETYAGSTDTYDLTVTDSEPKDIFYKVTDARQLGDGNKIAIVSEDHNVAMSTTQNSNNRGKTEITIENDSFERTNEVQVITLKHLDENWRLYTGSGYLCAASSSNNYLRTNETADGNSIVSIDITDGNASMVFQGNYKRNTLQYNSNSNLFSCYESASQESIQIYRQELRLSVSSAGYATFSSTSALDFTKVEDIYAYTATVIGNAINFQRVYKVPANTGLLLRSVNGGAVSTRVPLYDGANYDVTDNAFVAATTEIPSLDTTTQDGNYTNYILNKPSGGGIGFYKANGQKVGAGKAYLAVPKTAGVRGFISFDFSDPATGIATVGGNVIEGTAFDLQGRRVSTPKNGLYIINGKKMLVK